MLHALLLLIACHRDKENAEEGTPSDDTAPPGETADSPAEPEPIDVTGWEADLEVAPDAGTTQGEPSAIALPDGTLLASWMEVQDDGVSLYVTMTRSTDGGQTWSERTLVDEDRWGWQNDPVFAYDSVNGILYYTWLAVEDYRGSKSTIYCIDSRDGGQTWSDKTILSTEADSVDRQWAASQGDRVVMIWDSFPSASSTNQEYSESTTGCGGFSAPTEIASGIFLNGIPAIDTDGNVWASRNVFGRSRITHVVSKLEADGSWTDTTVQTYSYPDGAYYAMFAEREGEEGEGRGEEREPLGVPLNNLSRQAFSRVHGLVPERPSATARGTFMGEYSPVLVPLPTGGLAIMTMATDETDSEYADVYFMTMVDGAVSEPVVVNQDEGGLPQMEPWLAIDPAGGLHAIWYDGREDEWRLYSAHSLDGGATWSELQLGDNTFTRGFDENTYADLDAWVGHFQGLVTTEDTVVAVFGDSHTDGKSRIYSARSVSE